MCKRYYDADCGCYYEKECQISEDLQRDLEQAKDHFQGVLEMVYGRRKWDKMEMERHLDEVSFALGIKISEHDEIAI